MGEVMPVWQYALDVDIVLACAQDRDFATTFVSHCWSKKKAVAVGPTVIQELNYGATATQGWEKKTYARALQNLRQWCTPFDLKAVGHGLTERFALDLVSKGLVPEEEMNSGLILAEAALAHIPVLMSGNPTLLGLDEQTLADRCDHFDHPVRIQVKWPANLLTEWGIPYVN
jgi:hypothetical protein